MVGWILLSSSAMGNAVAGALASGVFRQVPPIEVVALGCVITGAVLRSCRRPRIAEWEWDRQRDAALLGSIIVVNAMFLYVAIDRLPLGTATTAEFLGPLALAVAHGGGARGYLAALAAIVGVAVVSGVDAVFEPIGLCCAFAAGACWAWYIVVNRRLGRHGSLVESLAGAFAFGGLISLPLAVVALTHVPSTEIAALLLAIALLGRLFPMACEIFALQRLTTAAASVLFAVVPAAGALSGFALLGQRLSFVQMIGLATVIGAGLIALRDAAP